MIELPDMGDSERDRIRRASPGLHPVGYVRSDYDDPARTPIQSLRDTSATARIEIFPEFATALDGLEGFDFVWLISWLDRENSETRTDWRVVPFLLAHTGQRVGAFASRHPARPNSLALSVVRLIAVDELSLRIQGVDLCHGTPVLDIKPWQQYLDIPGYSTGWEAVRDVRGGWYSSTGVAESDQKYPRNYSAE